MVSLLLFLNNDNIIIIILSPKRNCTMSFKQRPEASGIEGKKYRDSVPEHWPDSYRKNKSSAHPHSSPDGVEAFLEPIGIRLLVIRYLLRSDD